MATIVTVTDISGGDVVFDLVSSATYDNVRVEFVRLSDGTQLQATNESPAAAITVTFTSTVGVAMIVTLTQAGAFVESAPPVLLEGSDFGELATYICFEQSSYAQYYNVYRTTVSVGVSSKTLLGTTEVPFFKDTTAYADDAAAADTQYDPTPVVDGEEQGPTALTEQTRHAMPTCLVYGDVTDLFGQALYGQEVSFRPQDQLRGQIRGQRRQSVHNRQMTFRQIIMSPSRKGRFGAYLLQDARVTLEIGGGPHFTDFVVPRQASANLADLTLVPRFKSDTHG